MAVSQSLTVTEVAGSADIATNTSKVNIKWTSTQSGESYSDYTRTAYYYVSINGGAETQYSVSYTLPKGSTKTVVNTTITVPHKSDGSGTVKVRTWMDTRISAGVVEKSQTIDLTVIPRATNLDYLACATSYFTGTMTYKYTPQSSAMYNRCNISLALNGEYIAVKSVLLGQKPAAQQTATVTLTADELATVYNRLTSSPPKGTLRFTFRTYSDSGYSNQVGDYAYKELTLSTPDSTDTKPTVGMSLAPVGSLSDAFDGLYIKGKTKVKATLTSAPKYGATTKSYSMKVDGVSYGAGDSYTSAILSKYGSLTVTGYATDSRGFTGSMDKSIAVIDYAKPKIMNVEVFRCDANGNAADNGTYLKIKAERSYSKVVSNGVQKNFCTIRYRWKTANGSYSSWATILAKDAASDVVTTGALLGTLDAKTTYMVQVQAYDDIGEHAETEVNILTEAVYMHRTKNAMGLGKYAEGENLLDVAWDARFHGDVLIGDMTLREYILSIIEGG